MLYHFFHIISRSFFLLLDGCGKGTPIYFGKGLAIVDRNELCRDALAVDASLRLVVYLPAA